MKITDKLIKKALPSNHHMAYVYTDKELKNIIIKKIRRHLQ